MSAISESRAASPAHTEPGAIPPANRPRPGAGLPRLAPPNKKPPGLRPEGKGNDEACSAYFLRPRLNFVVNFSTRPAVSTKRFSPV